MAMESHYLHDFSSVRVHSGWSADRAAQETSSAAFATGNHLVFGAGHYSPTTPDGRRTLAHELAHVVQQRNGPVAGAPAGDGLLVSHPDDAFERAADSAAARLPPSGAAVPSAGDGRTRTRSPGDSHRPVIQRQAAPMVEPPPFELPPGEAANDNAEVDPVTGAQGPRYAPSPADTSLEAMFARVAISDYRARTLAEQERPVATLSPGGNPGNGFITVEGTRRYEWIGGPGGGGSGEVRNRKFHILDAIEYRVGRATTDEDLQAIVHDYLPTLGLMNELLRGRRPQPFRFPLISVPILDEPVLDPLLDPGGVARLAAFEDALERRVQQVPALAESRLRSRRTQRGRCQLVPTEPLGDDPLSSIYCHAVTGSPFSYRIYLPQASGAGNTQRWAEIDALRGNTWFECKCGYEHLLESWRGPGVLAKLTKQVLSHAAIARECGLEYRYIVSNERVRDILQDQWFGNVVIDVRPWEPCGPS